MRYLSDRVRIAIFLLLTTILFFLPVFTKRTVPLPLNLLVSFYSPWRYEGYKAPNKPIGFDDIRQMLPYMKFTKESILYGRVPLWNPYIFAGNPHAATLQPAVYYPATIFTTLFPLSDAWTLLIMMQPIIAGFFTYLFLRKLKLSKQAAVIGMLSFAFSGWMISWWEEFLIVVHSIMWLPLAMYASLLIWEKHRNGYLLLTLALSLSVLAGFTQSTLYLILTVISWNAWLWGKNKSTRPLGTIALSFITTLLVAAVQWIPAAETYLLSPRSTEDASYIFANHLLPLTHLVTLFAPDYWGNPGTYNLFGNPGFYQERMIYMGIAPLLLILLAFISVKNTTTSFFKWFTLLTFSMVFAIPTSWIWHTLRIPLLAAMQPTRIMMIASFGASVLAAYGFDEYMKRRIVRIGILPAILIFLIALGGWGWLIWTHIVTKYCPFWPTASQLLCPILSKQTLFTLGLYESITLRNLILPTLTLFGVVLVMVICVRKRSLLFITLVFIHLLTMGYFAHKYLYFSDRNNLYPDSTMLTEVKKLAGNDRVWGYGNASFENNILAYFDVSTPEGYAPFFPHEFGELMGSIGKQGAIDTSIPRSDVTLKHVSEDERMTDNPYRLRLMSLLGVKYIIETKNGEKKDVLTSGQRFPASLFTFAYENENWRVWEYKEALPRAFLASDVRFVPKKNMGSVLFNPSTNLGNTVLIDEPAPFTSEQQTGPKMATVSSYTSNNVTVKTSSNGPEMLFLSDSYYPGWNAYVDEKLTKIYVADYAFRAVAVPHGDHTVEFRYEPLSWKIGAAITLLGLLIWVYLVRSRRS